MKIKIAQKLPLYIGLIFAAFLASLAGKETLLMFGANSLAEQDSKLEHDWTFDAHLKDIAVLLKDAELDVHAYYVSGDRSYLPEPNALAERFENELRLLQAIPSETETQRKNFESFQNLANRHLQALKSEISALASQDNNSVSSPSLPSGFERNWEDIKALRALEAALQSEQSLLIKSQEAKMHRRYWYILVFCLVACAIFMLLLTLFYKVIRRYSLQLNNSKDELKSRNDDLRSDIALRAEQLTALSHHLLAVSEQEKANLARELHDELGSNITAMRLELAGALNAIKQEDSYVAQQIRKAQDLLQRIYEIKRRIIENLHPSTLENLGLAAAIRIHSDEVGQLSGLKIEVTIDDDLADVGPPTAIAIYRIVQESLTNTVKYAKAKCVSISLTGNEGGLRLHVLDDGIGVKAGALRKLKSHGILGMRERATFLGGTFDIRSGTGGRGTRIEVFIPGSGVGTRPQ